MGNMDATDIVIAIIVVLAVLLNSALLITLLKQPTILQPKNVLLLNLTLSNLIQGLFAYPIELYALVNKETTECVTSSVLVFMLSLVAIWSLTLLSVERLLSVKYPFLKERLLLFHKKKLLILSVFSIWLISAFWSITPLFGWGSYTKVQAAHRCNKDSQHRTVNVLSYTYILLLTCYVIPVTIMLYCFYNVKRELKLMLQMAKKNNGVSSKLSIDTRRTEKMQSRLVFVMILTYLIAWTPYTVIVLMLTFLKHVPSILYNISSLLAKSSSIYNPILYGFAYKDLRSGLQNMFSSKNKNKHLENRSKRDTKKIELNCMQQLSQIDVRPVKPDGCLPQVAETSISSFIVPKS